MLVEKCNSLEVGAFLGDIVPVADKCVIVRILLLRFLLLLLLYHILKRLRNIGFDLHIYVDPFSHIDFLLCHLLLLNRGYVD